MLNQEIDIVAINVMGREFKIKCPKDKIAELKGASDYLNSKMLEVKHGDKLITIDRVAITAALNIAHDLFLEREKTETRSNSFKNLNKKLLDLEQKIDMALASTN